MTAASDAKPLKGLFISTYGCQMNVYDSERIRDVLKPLGYAPVDAPEGADLVVINTCHIREKATEKVYSELGKLKQMKLASGGKMTIAVAGCVAQAEGAEIIRRQPAVDLVLGPQAYHKLPEMIARASRAVGDRLETGFDTVEKFDALPKTRDPDGPTAFVSVQEGCDKFCTFCVVPYTRGAEMSRSVDDIVSEVRDLAAKGVRVVATDFIVGFPGESDADFEATMQLARDIDYAIAYSFKYSARPGTPATEMHGHVSEAVKDERLQALQALLRDQQTAFNRSQVDKTLPVLVTGKGRISGQMHGRSPYLQSVHFEGPDALVNSIVDVKIVSATMSSLTGEPVRVRETAQ